MPVSALAGTPGTAEGYLNAAKADEDPASAQRMWEAGIAAHPTDHALLEGFSAFLLENGPQRDARRAEILTRKALAADPQAHPCGDHAHLAKALHLQGRETEALTEIDAALKTCPSHSGAAELRLEIVSASAKP